MRNNKILAITMATALGGMLGSAGALAAIQGVCFPTRDEDGRPGVGLAGTPLTTPGLCNSNGDTPYGGTGTMPGGHAPTGTNEKLASIFVATEAIGSSQPLPSDGVASCNGGAQPLVVSYVTEADWSENTLVTISLVDSSGKAVFGYSGLDSTSTSGVITNAILVVQDENDGNATAFGGDLVVSSGGIGETSIGFTVQPIVGDQLDEGSTLDFYFCIDKADVLKTAGQSIGVSVEAGGATSTLSTVITAKSGAKMDITAGADKDEVEVDVGGEAGAKKFIGSSINETTAILGEICLESAGAIYDNYLTNLWSPFGNADSITFTITNAPFSASISHEVPTDDDSDGSYTEDQVSKVMVFLDLDRNDKFSEAVVDGTLDTGGDIPATTVTTTTATFEITDDDLPYLEALMGTDDNDYGFQHADANGCVNVIFKVSGDTVIETFDTPPVGEMVIDFARPASITDNLNHIKKSGTFCTLYNIPGPSSIENANVRVINKSGDEGTLFGTLRLPDGTEPFSNVSLGVIARNATFYISTEGLGTIAKNNGWDKGWSRAILELESNLDEVEMMALVRDDDVMGAPLMNMSVGATGNGCGR